jgi:fatty acid desaturase
MVLQEHLQQNILTERVCAGPYRPYRHTLLTPRQINELSKLQPWRSVTAILFCWACLLAAFALVAFHPAWWTVLVAIPVIGNRYYALFIIGHDGMHRRLLRHVNRNDFWTDLLILAPIGAITRINNRNHLAHHRSLSMPEDPDRHKYACFNKADHAELLGYLSGIRSVWNTVKYVYGARHHKSSKPASGEGSYSARDIFMLAGWFVVLAGGLTWWIGWWAYPLLWLLPVYLFTYLGDNFRSFAEHSHPESDHDSDQHRMISYISNPIERALISPMNMNYHAVHHLWPSIPYYNLPRADRLVRMHPDSIAIEWRRSYCAYLWKYWSALPIEECKTAR